MKEKYSMIPLEEVASKGSAYTWSLFMLGLEEKKPFQMVNLFMLGL